MSSTEKKSLINKLTVDSSKEPIFFGQPLGLQRYDLIKNQGLWSYFSKQLAFFWRPEEISIGKDADIVVFNDNIDVELVMVKGYIQLNKIK